MDTKGKWTSTDAMRPTQCAVGYIEVDLKMQELRERAQKNGNLEKYLKGHPIPAVLGPDGRMYLTMKQFFAKMEEHHRRHPFDGQGQRVSAVPKYLSDLVDDPYRSLAGLARKAGAYDKVDVPFTEFKWADYLRGKVDVRLIRKQSLAQAIHVAVVLTHQPAAAALPGFHGVQPESDLPTLTEIQDRLTKRYGADDAAPDLPRVAGKRA
jgi:hypothetical protein